MSHPHVTSTRHRWQQALLAGVGDGLAVGLCIAAMIGTRVVHPPAGSNPLLVFALKPGWLFLISPALLGSLALVLLAWAWRRLAPHHRHET
jgi:CBS-domain-containing membrane protein